ncbi:MAG: hypothetical protein JW912_06160 [Sedimentisphaerales bacterium]|nr:hypothetical protein [Sedimentisphaerales bacterium]
MTKKKGNFVELYIDKVVLGVAIIISLILLWIFVLSSPYSVEYDGRKFTPSQIDPYIKKQVTALEEMLNEPVETKEYEGQQYIDRFLSALECPIVGISKNVYYPLPPHGVQIRTDNPVYEVPQIGLVQNPIAEAIRSVAHVPTEAVDVKVPYSSVLTELGDIDLVTVQASFDVAELYKNFQNSFSGPRVRGDWRDNQLAKPVFASVELQRRELLDNKKWSEWSVVPRSKIEHLSSLLAVPERAKQLSFGINFIMDQFKTFEMQREILQPEAYEFATNSDEWLPPEYHKDLIDILEKEREEAKRQELEQKKAEREAAKQQARQDNLRQGAAGGPGGGMMRGLGGGGTQRNQPRSRQPNSARLQAEKKEQQRKAALAKAKKEEKSVKSIFDEFETRLLEEDTNLSTMRDPLIFWSYDDTVEAGQTYQYRIRLGVFNPIAGMDWFTEEQKSFMDQVVLWSDFSDVTEEISIPKMVQLFPIEVAKDDEKSVTIKVAKFHHGKWRSHDFTVGPGQEIGYLVKEDPKEEKDKNNLEDMRRADVQDVEISNEIDFSTGVVLVDIVTVSDWEGETVLSPRSYADVLYTEDGENIKHFAVKSTNWPSDIKKEFYMIKQAEEEKVMVFYTRGQGGVDKTRTRATTPVMPMGMPGGFMGPGMMPGGIP